MTKTEICKQVAKLSTSFFRFVVISPHQLVYQSVPFVQQWNDANELTVTGKIKEAIMKLLIQCLPASGANLAHYLLGFNLKNIKKTILQSPGTYSNLILFAT